MAKRQTQIVVLVGLLVLLTSLVVNLGNIFGPGGILNFPQQEPLKNPPPAPGSTPQDPPGTIIDGATDRLPAPVIESVGGEIGSIFWLVETDFVDGTKESFEEGRQAITITQQLAILREGKEISQTRFSVMFDLAPGLSVDTVTADYRSKLFERGPQFTNGINFISNIPSLTSAEGALTTLTVPFDSLPVTRDTPLAILVQAEISMVVFTSDGNRYLATGRPTLLRYNFEIDGISDEIQQIVVETEPTPEDPGDLTTDKVFQATGIISNPTQNCGGVSCTTGNDIIWVPIRYCRGEFLGIDQNGVHQCANNIGIVSTSVGEEDLPGFLASIAAAGYEVAELN